MKKQAQIDELKSTFDQLTDKLLNVEDEFVQLCDTIKTKIKELDDERAKHLTAPKDSEEFWKQYDEYNQSELGETQEKMKDELEMLQANILHLFSKVTENITVLV